MGAIGPVTLEEARDVLAERLRTLDEQPPANRYGRVFVGSPQQRRGRVFKVVFVPALAERLFPQKPREDPMLLDVEMRVPLDAGLFVQEDRLKNERLLLRLAVGRRDRAAVAVVSAAGRQRRATAGAVVLHARRDARGHRAHSRTTKSCSATRRPKAARRLDWPAPADPRSAIDDVEHDLATLRELIAHADRASCAATRTTCSA